MTRDHHAEMARRHADAAVKYPDSLIYPKERDYHLKKVSEHDAKRAQESGDAGPGADAPDAR